MSDDLLKLIHEDVKEIKKDVSELKGTAIKHDINLEMHMEQSRTLKKLYEHLDENRIQPLEKELAELKGARSGIYRFIGLLIALGGMIAAFLLLKH
jgi:hypothetical protein